jgi:glyoxylase-like metal-dependent hydrolase (beta-lactamase superfamily II)
MRFPIRVLAPNPGPFTLEGTNTWVVGSSPALVIDPGPADQEHIDEVIRTARSVSAILLTHRHLDHAPGAALLAAGTGARVFAFRPQAGEAPLQDGQVIEGGCGGLIAVHTPGHTADHVTYHDPALGSMFTGDAVLGRGTSIVDPPEGDMASYMVSLERMRGLSPRVLYPGHGPVAWDAKARLEEYLEHRRMRERQVMQELRAGLRTPEELVATIYAGYPLEMRPAAVRSVLAHLLKLERDQRVRRGPAGQDGAWLARRPDKRAHGAIASGTADDEGTT